MWNRRRTGWIGVALGPHCLKAAQVEWSGRTLRLRAAAAWHAPETAPRTDANDPAGTHPAGAAVPAGAPVPTGPNDPDTCTWAGPQLRTLFEAVEGFRGNTIACAPPIRLTDLHTLAVPPGSVGERRAMIANQLSSILARQAASQRQFDYWDALRPASAPPEETDVNVASLPRAYVDELLIGLSEAGLRCEVLDARPFALARALRIVGGSYAHQPVAALEWDRSGTTFCVAVGGNPLFARELRNCGFEVLSNPVSAALGLAPEETFEVLSTYGLPNGRPGAGHQREVQEVVGEACEGALKQVSHELQKTLDYVRMQFAAIQPKRLCLLGDGAAVRNLPAALQQRLNLPVDIWRPAGWMDDRPGAGTLRGPDDDTPAQELAPVEQLAQAERLASAADDSAAACPGVSSPACLAAAIALSTLVRES